MIYIDENLLGYYIIEHITNLDTLRILYPNIKFQRVTDRIAIIYASPSATYDLNALRNNGLAVFIPLVFGLNAQESLVGVNMQDVLSSANISQLHTYPSNELRGKNVLIGFVDTGIDYTNPLFKYEDNTSRIVSIWDQTIEGNPPIDNNIIADYGSVYSNAQINQALNSSNPLSIVPSIDTVGHGTYLAGVAAGKDRSGNTNYTGGAPDSELVIVKLRPATELLRAYYLISPTANAYQANDVMTGINYLLKVAREKNMPIAICLGLGCNLGAHNGLTIIERFLSEVSDLYNVILVSSAGNEASEAHHFSNTIKINEVQSFELNIAEQETGLVFGLWATGADKLSVGFTTPLGNAINKIPMQLTNSQTFSFNLERSRVSIQYQFPNLITGSESIKIRLMDPLPGIWTFYVYGDFVISGDYNVWLEREGFIQPNTRFLSPDPYITVCIPSTTQKLLVVGAYNSFNDSLYAASGRGPTTNSVIKPDIIAPGVDVPGPNLYGGFTAQTGTSVAAAITASASALLLEWAVVENNFNLINTNIARTIFIRGASRTTNGSYPNYIEGYGKLDLLKSISLI